MKNKSLIILSFILYLYKRISLFYKCRVGPCWDVSCHAFAQHDSTKTLGRVVLCHGLELPGPTWPILELCHAGPPNLHPYLRVMDMDKVNKEGGKASLTLVLNNTIVKLKMTTMTMKRGLKTQNRNVTWSWSNSSRLGRVETGPQPRKHSRAEGRGRWWVVG